MGGDVLSQAEVESLLNAMSANEEAANADEARPAAASSSGPPKIREKITPYDFKRRSASARNKCGPCRRIHEGFGRNFGAAVHAAADDRGSEAHQRRPAHLRRVRVQPGKPHLLQPAQGGAAGREPDPRHQPFDSLPHHRSALGGRTRRGRDRPPPLDRNRTPPGVADHQLVPRSASAGVGERAGVEAGSAPRREQPTIGADRSAQRSGGTDQLRAGACATSAAW